MRSSDVFARSSTDPRLRAPVELAATVADELALASDVDARFPPVDADDAMGDETTTTWIEARLASTAEEGVRGAVSVSKSAEESDDGLGLDPLRVELAIVLRGLQLNLRRAHIHAAIARGERLLRTKGDDLRPAEHLHLIDALSRARRRAGQTDAPVPRRADSSKRR